MRTNMSRTENGALTLATSGSTLLDLFFNVGAARGNVNKVADDWFKASMKDQGLALRVALWARDARGGAGERDTFRAMLKAFDREAKFDRALLEKIAEVGRADDLLVIEKNFDVMAAFYKDMIDNSKLSGLFAKWAPRQGPIANKLRKAWKMGSPKAYRQYLVERTNVVEQLMCAREWTEVEYEGVPSVAMARYNRAFQRNDGRRFEDYRKSLESGEAKINAGAIFPYDVVRAGRAYETNKGVVEAQWKALPDFIKDASAILPMCDVSGSMGVQISGSVTAMDVSIALGMYISERQKGPFKDLVMTFSGRPQFHKVQGKTIIDRIRNLESAEWGMNTNIEAAFQAIRDLAVKNKVPAGDMPKYLVVLSDMEFDSATRGSNTNFESARRMFAQAGYELPKVVFWNLNSRTKNVPVSMHQSGTALVSGFSPAIMKTVLEAERFDPMSIMLDTVNSSRYDVEGWTV